MRFCSLKTNSIASKFRLSYLLFTLLLCFGFISVFNLAENEVEKQLAQSRLLQQFQLNLDQYGTPAQIHSSSGISIYHFEDAPKQLQQQATDEAQEIKVIQDNKKIELQFFKYQHQGQDYILSYADNGNLDLTQYPVLSVFESLEDIFYQALFGVLAISILTALLFSYLSSKAIIRPILDLKQAVEDDNRSLSNLPNLPSELEILAKTIDEKNQQLSRYLAREQLFTGDVSHELRTPLTIIMGASEVLESQLAPDSKLREFSNRISTTAKETSDMVSALLILSRAPETLDKPQTAIIDIVNKEVERLQYLIRFKPVRCVVTYGNDSTQSNRKSHGSSNNSSNDSSNGYSNDSSNSHLNSRPDDYSNRNDSQNYTAFVRPELLKMAVGNLIKNAFQYTDSGEVRIHIDHQKITVSDSGLGIPEDMMPVVYERFGRLQPTSTTVEGTGLGLSIVQRIMLHLGWTLTYHPNEHGGSTFSIIYSEEPHNDTQATSDQVQSKPTSATDTASNSR